MHKKLSKGNFSNVLAIVLLIIILLGTGFFIWFVISKNQLQTNPAESSKETLEPTTNNVSDETPATSIPQTSKSSQTQTVDQTNQYKIPNGEQYQLSSQEDTNGDGNKETLVITSMSNGKYHAYILSKNGDLLFENKELVQKPLRISTTKYESTEKYPSWMLVFTEESGSLAIIHWNGTTYEIPPSLGI